MNDERLSTTVEGTPTAPRSTEGALGSAALDVALTDLVGHDGTDATTDVAKAVAIPTPKGPSPAEVTDRQMGISVADRANREAAGLTPRTHDLR